MIGIHHFEVQVSRAEALLEKSLIREVNKDLIRRFVLQKTAEKVKAPRLAKYLGTLRLIAERYLQDRDFSELSKEDLIGIVAAGKYGSRAQAISARLRQAKELEGQKKGVVALLIECMNFAAEHPRPSKI